VTFEGHFRVLLLLTF